MVLLAMKTFLIRESIIRENGCGKKVDVVGKDVDDFRDAGN